MALRRLWLCGQEPMKPSNETRRPMPAGVMRSRAIKLLLLAGALIMVPIALSVGRWLRDDGRFDRTRLVGLSTNEVQRILGPPEFIEETNTWLYFRGSVPAAALVFSGGHLHALEKFK
jgi:hypothetical protein